MAEENKEEKTEEKKEEEEPKKEPEPEKTETSPLELAKTLDESIKKGNEEFKGLLDRQEKMLADARVEGRAFAGQTPQEPKKLTDTEYSEALERGEVNPLKEDGFLK